MVREFFNLEGSVSTRNSVLCPVLFIYFSRKWSEQILECTVGYYAPYPEFSLAKIISIAS